MVRPRALFVTILALSAAVPVVTVAAQQPGSVTAPAAPKAAMSSAPLPVGIPIDRVVGVVGDHPILWSDILEAIYYLKGQGDSIPADSAGLMTYARERLSDMIDQEVLIAVAKQYKSEVDDKEITPDIDKRIKDMRARFKSEAEYRAALKSDGFGSEAEARTSLLESRRRESLQQQAMDSLKAHGRLDAPVTVTEQEITDAFEKAKAKIGTRPATVAFKQIIIAPKANPVEREKARAKAESLLIAVQKGADFEATAKKYSMDPTTKDQGGALPFVRRTQMVESFDRAIFSGAPPGTIIPVPIESPFGFHIIRIDRVQPGQVKSSHILIIPKLDSSDVARARLVADTVIQKWRTGTPYDSLVKYYHDPTELRIVTETPIDSLPVEYKAAFDGVKKGQLTRPFDIPDPRTGFSKVAVALLDTRQDGGEFTVVDLRDRIREQLIQEKAQRRVLDQLRREQYVSIKM